MPSKTAKQRKFMAAAAHSKEFAHKVGMDREVAKEFHAADKRRANEYHGYLRMNKKDGGF